MTLDLFSASREKLMPLAERVRPQSLEEFVGQNHLVGSEKFITKIMGSGLLPSLILWGPPGTGKTTLARLLAQKKGFRFEALSAVTSGIKDVKEVVAHAEENLKFHSQKTILFVDEIHRFNKSQQDAFLPHIEKGTIILIGATTENPSFEVIGPLLSRCKVLVLQKLEPVDLDKILQKALQDPEKGLGKKELTLKDEVRSLLIESSDGDARRMLNTLETAASFVSENDKQITLTMIEMALQKKALLYDKSGEEHYNIISAFIKSMRDSDADAAVYYLARMLEAGEEPLFLARRMVIFASEDVSNADPQAVQVAVACMQSFDFVGMPEGWIPLAQCATYLAGAPKSNASYMAYKKAKADVHEYGTLPVPLHLRNAPTKLMKALDYGKNYKYAHDEKDHIGIQQDLPEKLAHQRYYEPTENGYEATIKAYLEKVKERKTKD